MHHERFKLPPPPFTGILSRLRRDRRGNVLAIMAASLIPLIGFSGSAVDMARLYIVKVRLQQACDAGVLAGRRIMTDTSMNTPLEEPARTQARAFFANNFRNGYLRSTAIDFKPVKAAASGDPSVGNAVTATATATVPLSVMGYFNMKPVKIDVACQAVFDLADADVMFVLDTTGSMSCLPSDPATCAAPIAKYKRADGSTGWANTEKDGSKIDGLRDAVVLFDDTMRANADKSTRVRYGFVTYSSSVNVGAIIPPTYLQRTSWTYQSRALSPDAPSGVPGALPGDYAYGNAVSVSLPNVPKAMCVSQRAPTTGFAKTGYTWADQGYYQARSYYNLSWTAANGGTCSGTQQPLRAKWRYGPVSYPIDQWVAGNEVVNPTRLDGSKSRWTGCIEELDTTPGSSFDVTNLPNDLDPDVRPTDNDNKWRPQWPDVEWNRGTFGPQDVEDDKVVEYGLSRDWPNIGVQYYNRNYGTGYYYDDTGSAPCGMQAQLLRVWTAQQVTDYVHHTDFRPYGGTYHDVGMIWGTRMLSPDGIFAANNAPPAGRNQPTRNIVFMTDGTMAPNQTSYGQYGVELWDNRTGGQNNTALDTVNHTARFRVECDAAKRKGFTIYVVALGTAVTNDLIYCASPGQTYQASSTPQLTAAFRAIAQRVAMLRISK